MQRPDASPSGDPTSSLERGREAIRDEITADLCIIGAGAGGLSLAATASQLGLEVVLIERHKMGGDCLNYGCVPSKALIAASRRAHVMRSSGAFGVDPVEPRIDYPRLHDHVHEVITSIAPNDSVARFTGLGVKVIQASGAFVGRNAVQAGHTLVRARRFCIATGSSPFVPPIPGLGSAPHFTNETIFDNTQPLGHLIVVGGGPIGIELAQAHLRLGNRVTVLESLKALGKDDPELAEVVLKKLAEEGLTVREGTKVERVEHRMGVVRVHVSGPDGPEVIEGNNILIAAGRKPNVDGLGLEAAGIAYDHRGIRVGSSLATSNSKVYAIGDVTGGLQFTHVASYHATVVLKRVCFRWPARATTDHIPWVTFTDPELAGVGLTEDEARRRYGAIHVYRWPYHDNDRAQAERATDGFVKVLTDKRGRIVGAAIVGLHAGELIQMWSLAISKRLKISDLTHWVSPYPTLGEINKRAALRYYASKAGSPLVRGLISFLSRLG